MSQRDFYEAASSDTSNKAFATAISRNRCTEIFLKLQVADNAILNDGRYYKIHPLYEIFNQNVIQ